MAGRRPGKKPYETLRRRADFLAANRGRRAPMPGFILLLRDRGDGDSLVRVGLTVSRKVGGAVVRNRMKRRFRALARELLPESGIGGADMVLIGRPGGIEREYDLLRDELRKALRKILDRPSRESGNPDGGPRGSNTDLDSRLRGKDGEAG